MRSNLRHHGCPTVSIDAFPESLVRYRSVSTIVAVDVIRSTTMAVTAAEQGWKCYPVPTLEDAIARADTLESPLLAGELGGQVPYAFEMDNSPVELLERRDRHRPLVLLSTSGTRVICGAAPGQNVQVACLRNYRATVGALLETQEAVAIIGAGARGEFRDEDALCCAWIARDLVKEGYVPADARTAALIERWDGVEVSEIVASPSAEFLRRTGRHGDLAFIVDHVDDLCGAVWLAGGALAYGRCP